MVRVVPGGAIVTYMWDMLGGGFPLEAMGMGGNAPTTNGCFSNGSVTRPVDRRSLEDVQTKEITVHRTFANFADFWTTNLKSPALLPTVAAMKSGDVEMLISRVRARMR